MSRSLLALAAFAAAALAFARPAQSQCGPDGLVVAGACCQPVAPTLPFFPPMSISSEGNCIRSCTPSAASFPVTINLAPPIPIFCDVYVIPTAINGAVNLNPAILAAKYARTWIEPTATGVTRQVWRFLVNGDFTYQLPLPPVPSPCPIPKIALNGQPVHFVGHVDYALDCSSGTWDAAISLAHLCGAFNHAPWSAQPMNPDPNPDQVYAFVGPTPFLWGGGPAPAGPVIGDAVRSTNASFTSAGTTWQCLSEGPVLGGQLTNVAPYCPCGTLTPADPWTQQNLVFQYAACLGTPFFAFVGIPFPPIVPTGLGAVPLGTWAVPGGVFPETRRLHHYFGLSNSGDPCVTGALPIHITNGVVTSGALGVVDPPPPGGTFTCTVFLDLQNTLLLTGSAPFLVIGYGGLFLSTRIWSLNLP